MVIYKTGSKHYSKVAIINFNKYKFAFPRFLVTFSLSPWVGIGLSSGTIQHSIVIDRPKSLIGVFMCPDSQVNTILVQQHLHWVPERQDKLTD